MTPVSLVAGTNYYLDAVCNGSTAATLSGLAALAPEVQGGLAIHGGAAYRWCTNSGSLGTAPPVPGTSTLSYASNVVVSNATGGFFVGLL